MQEFKEELRESIATVLSAECNSLAIHAFAENKNSLDTDVWRHACELGWAAAIIPEQFGGLGLGYDVVPLMHREIGAYLTPGDFIANTAFIACLNSYGDEVISGKYLSDILSGDLSVMIPAETSYSATLDEGVLGGASEIFYGPSNASLLIVSAQSAGGHPVIAITDTQRLASEPETLDALDHTRRRLLRRVSIDGARVETVLEGERAVTAYKMLVNLSRVAIAADSLGAGFSAIRAAVEYLKERRQFDQTIASFQAIKHRCANISMGLKLADGMLRSSTEKLINGDRNADAWIGLAKAECDEAATFSAADTIQLHGGVGYTWEYDCHFYLHRTKLNEKLFGDAHSLREDSLQLISANLALEDT